MGNNSISKRQPYPFLLGEKIIDFNCNAIQLNKKIKNFSLNITNYMKNADYLLFLSFPGPNQPFHGICITEIMKLIEIQQKLIELQNVKILGLMCDDPQDITNFLEDIEIINKKLGQSNENQKINFPMLSDPDKQNAYLFGMIHSLNDSVQLIRSSYIIDKNKTVRWIQEYPIHVGRNFSEIENVLDSLEINDKYRLLTPADHEKGGLCIVHPDMDDIQAQTRYDDFEIEHLPSSKLGVKNYLRYARKKEQ